MYKKLVYFVVVFVGIFFVCVNIYHINTESKKPYDFICISKDSSLLFSKNNNMTFQQAYDLLVEKLGFVPFVDEKVFVVGREFYFPRAEVRKFNYTPSRGYYMDPKTKEIRFEDNLKKIYFEEGDYSDNGFIIKWKKM